MLRKPSEIIINGKSLEEMISEQRLEIQSLPFGGPRVDLSELDLSYTDLRDVDLKCVDLKS